MREEFVRVGVGAEIGGVDAVAVYTGGLKLVERGLAEIEVALIVAAGAKRSIGTHEALEGGEDFGADLEGVKADAGTDGGDERGCWGGAGFFELPHGGADYAGDQPAPTGVDGGDRAAVG